MVQAALQKTSLDAGPRRAGGDALAAEARFAADLGGRIRTLRDRRGMSRKLLARTSNVSERYLAQIESGNGNISVMLLRRVAHALGVAIGDVLEPGDEAGAVPRRRIALIGMRGAGKSTLGAMLAEALHLPLTELRHEVTRETGLPAGEVIALYGHAAYRRIERRVLARVAREQAQAVIVAGGGIVDEEDAFDLLRANCYTAWIKARPEEHMARVLAQGDLRPMAGNARAMDDLKRILAARDAMYRRADVTIDTSGETAQQSFAKLRAAVASAFAPATLQMESA
ncbi:MAG TPA: helix-turn-helix transcriptional regulator [Casimicrobiaceae bacterium]|nr:helix-turn-helix transcriptional regulator [Casimicrobiaceae bacterium]